MSIEELRKKINGLDEKIVRLINERAAHAREIGKIKKRADLAVYAPEREKEIYAKLATLNRGPLSHESLCAIYREIMSAAIALEKEIVVSYLGPEATFTHLAARRKFGSSVTYAPAKTISEVFTEVERGRTDYGVVPIENSFEGAVTHTLDMFMEKRVKICAEKYLEITHCFLSNSRKNKITRIYSNPQVFGQCRVWLRTHYPAAELVEVSSTARAAARAAKEKGAAALASELAAELYGVNLIERGIEESGNNETRFLVISRISAGRSGDDKTSIMVSISDKVGALYQMLYPFKENGINLSRIASRPSKKRAWEYCFFIDFFGHIEDDNVACALEGLEKESLFVEHLGSYPREK